MENIKILCLCPTRQICTSLHSKINHLLFGIDNNKYKVDLIIPGQPQSKQQTTLRLRPHILITTPVLMTDFILKQHSIKDYVAHSYHKNMQKLFNCIAIINIDRCIQAECAQNIDVIFQQCNITSDVVLEKEYDHDQQRQVLISSNCMSADIDEFVSKLMPNKQDLYKLIVSNDNDNVTKSKEDKSDFLPNTNDYELDDKILLNTLAIQTRLQEKQHLMSQLNALLQRTEYASMLSTAQQLKDGSYHQTFNTKDASNLSAKLNRMESKTKFMGKHSQQLIDNLDFQRMQRENQRLQHELQESEAQRHALQNDKKHLTEAINLKISKIREVEEEKGIVIGELRISLEEMSSNQKKLKQQMTEEKDLLTRSLHQMIETLTTENHNLRQQQQSSNKTPP